jgi:hypothetical protein
MIASLCGPLCGGRLFLHVLGATVLFGGTLTVATLVLSSLRTPQHALLLRRLAFTTTIAVVWPAFVAMRIGAELVLKGEHLEDSNATWIGIGFGVSDGGLVVLLLLGLTTWLARRHPRAAPWAAGLSVLYVAALAVAWFAMSGKPGA